MWKMCTAFTQIILLFSFALNGNLADDADATSTDECMISNIPQNGFIKSMFSSTIIFKLNEIIENYGEVQYECEAGYTLRGNRRNICIDGSWQHQTPDCKLLCDISEVTSVTFIANCFENVTGIEKQFPCYQSVNPGTVAKINCQRGYENENNLQQILICGNDGKWKPQPVPCKQICGLESPEGTPFIVHGEYTDIIAVPWHVALYQKIENKFKQICGGTILNAKVVITAMHCFWNRQLDKPFDISEFRVIAGKFFRDYDNFNIHISPICVDYDEKPTEVEATELTGRVAGWGLESSGGSPSPILKVIHIPIVSREECISKSKETFLPFITDDKFCAGYLTGESVCQGDSGGGLVFTKIVNGTKRSYLKGIVSVGSIKEGSCDNFYYTAFTNVAYFAEFIKLYEVSHRPGISNKEQTSAFSQNKFLQSLTCTFTDIPIRGYVTLANGTGDYFKIGESVENFQVVEYHCYSNYSLIGNTRNICNKGSWISEVPQCIPSANISSTVIENRKPCRIISRFTNGWIELAYSPFQLLSIGDVINSGTEITYSCRKNFVREGHSTNLCVEGEWKNDVPYCRPYCRPEEINARTIRASKCMLYDKPVSCSALARVETKAEVNCAKFYEPISPNSDLQTVSCGDDGQWIPEPRQCKPTCGIPLSKEAQIHDEERKATKDCLKLVAGNCWTEGPNRTFLRWHATIIDITTPNENKFLTWFDGTILSSRIIATELLHFWDRANDELYPLKNYQVAVGRNVERIILERNREGGMIKKEFVYNIQDVQYSNIVYRSGRVVEAAFALVILRESIEFNDYIAPICLYPKNDSPAELNTNGQVAMWIGWNTDTRYTFDNVEKHNCQQHADALKVKYSLYTYTSQSSVDVFCGVNDNNITHNRGGFCGNFNGVGWTYPFKTNEETKYYLGGILTGPSIRGSCDKYLNIFIDIETESYRTFINSVVKTIEGYSILERRPCEIEKNPSVFNFREAFSPFRRLSVGDLVASGDKVTVECDGNGYPSVDLDNTNLCIQGKWKYQHVACLSFCGVSEMERLAYALTGSCISSNGSYYECPTASYASRKRDVIEIKCENLFQANTSVTHVECGEDGKWFPKPVPCNRKCGEIPESELYPNGTKCMNLTTVAYGEDCEEYTIPSPAIIPWHVDILESNQSRCMGTIVSHRIIVTDLLCFWDFENNKLKNLSDFRAVTNYNLKSTDEGFHIEWKHYSVEAIESPHLLRNECLQANSIKNLITLVILTESIAFDREVAPACLFPNDSPDTAVDGILADWESRDLPRDTKVTYLVSRKLPVLPEHKCQKPSSEWSEYLRLKVQKFDKISDFYFFPQFSGNGWVYPLKINDTQKYYLGGIVGAKSIK